MPHGRDRTPPTPGASNSERHSGHVDVAVDDPDCEFCNPLTALPQPSAPQALDVPEGCTEAGLFRIPFDRDARLLPPEADEWDEQAIGAFYAGVAEGVAVVEHRYSDSAEWRRSSVKAARSRLPSEEERHG